MDPFAEIERLKRELEAATAQIRKTTLKEYIAACHELVFTQFAVETNQALTSKGHTKVHKKRLPGRLENWIDFREEQQDIIHTLISTFPEEKRAFGSLSYLAARGVETARGKVGDEDRLRSLLSDLLTEPLSHIIENFQQEDAIQARFDLGTGIKFENRMGAVADAQEPRTPEGRQIQPDQICAVQYDANGRTKVAYVMEYKPPHKLTLQHFRLGLHPMDIYKDVVNRATIPTSDEVEARLEYHADKLVAAVIAQTFDYMVETGLSYSFITTGEAIVFLKLDWTDPTTLYYFLVEPGSEIDEVQGDRNEMLYRTAVSQVLAFTVLALGAPPRPGQDERRRLTDDMKTWSEDWESILQAIPPTERSAPPTSPAWRPPRKYNEGVKRSEFVLRPSTKAQTKASAAAAAAQEGCKPDDVVRRPTPEESDDSGGEAKQPSTPSPTLPRRRVLAQRPRGGSGGGASGSGSGSGAGSTSQRGAADRQYCTHKCLLGLVRGKLLDEACPNVDLHRSGKDLHVHAVDHATWLDLLRAQFERTLDDGIEPLGKYGARGIIFKVTLLSHGYTFISKATVGRFRRELEREGKAYGRMEPLQGINIPVFLGAIDIRDVGRVYYYDYLVHVVYFTFLSWAGVSLAETTLPEEEKEGVLRDVVQTVRAMHSRGVAHTDVERRNVLWDQTTGRVMVIDFEQAVLLPSPRPALAPVVPNKRRAAGAAEVAKGAGLDVKAALTRLLHDDVFAARVLLAEAPATRPKPYLAEASAR